MKAVLKRIYGLAYMMMCLFTSMIGYQIHGSIFWSIMDWIFMPFTWCKWMILKEVNVSIIQETFSFFLQ